MNYTMNTLKAFGIILVVFGHSGCAVLNWFNPYSFHIPLFIFISGYFYKTEHEKSLVDYFTKKAKSLLLPYYGWNLFYGLVVMLLLKNHLIDFGSGINLKTLFIEPWISGHQYAFNSAGWFVLTLFLIITIYTMTRKLLKKLVSSEYGMLIFYFSLGLIGVYLANQGYAKEFKLTTLRILFGLPFFYLGFLYKEKIEKHDRFSFLALTSLLVIQGALLSWENNKLDFYMVWMKFHSNNIFAPFLSSVTGIYLYVHCAKIVTKFNQGTDKLLNLIGNSTWSIMIHHIFAFWLINFCFYKLHITGLTLFTNFDVIQYKSNIWYKYLFLGEATYVIYVVAGLFIPIAIQLIVKNLIKLYYESMIFSLIKKKLYIN
ncbi:acyltransferase family protein [Sporomusa sphaeroides DSM 2875]|uniref:acyltransferase family protein n=1 Tax=Sporomusa sphaeroides TaxID=47679 RepID=UPI00202EEBC9|nr:acyltransferase family protein [Sporomusa sphaeroides]MCM0757335.1 acyltransferase family protein [Sporomusa sphaeroides DSM 2875]